MILQSTGNKKNLRDVCVLLYERFGKTGKGYTEKNIVELVNEVSNKDFSGFFETYVYTPADFEIPLKPCFDYLGIEFVKENSPLACETNFGFKAADNGPFSKITLVAPYSPAWKAGLFAGDEIIAVNSMVLKNNLNNWLGYFLSGEEIALTVNSNDVLKTITLQHDKKGATWFFNPVLKIKDPQGAGNKENFGSWKNF
jgi:predicted metalloprotease with PDZ domain